MNCINCGSNENIHLHHVVPLALGGNDISSNKVPLCGKCHALVHGFKDRGVHWKELQRAGIEKTKAEGKNYGRPSKKKPNNWNIIYEKYIKKENTATELIKMCNVSKTTFYKWLKEEKHEYI